MTRTLVVLAGHGSLPSGMRDAVELILGEQPRLRVAELPPEQTPEGFRRHLLKVLDEGTPAVVLTDVFGGTPHNVAAVVAAGRDDVEVLTGLSLPMLVEVITSGADRARELAEVGVRAGREGAMHTSLMTRVPPPGAVDG
ncbi:PTS sugar transporter subunit IIA [Actinosynnema sp. NPDC020468]|uniref:PTS sugar transporter subunit IIA n=1 Tax=Actinosynnema sp. NPDC020468 TaxID=3154488 RepID=UPI0033C4FC3A